MSVNTALNNSANKLSINLLQPELLPEKVTLTLPRVVIVWGVFFLAMLAWVLQANYTQQNLKEKLSVLQQENSKHTDELSLLTAQLAARKVDRQLADKLETIQLLMSNKQALHTKLTNPNKTYAAGFSAAMNDLAKLHHQDIRLESININNDNMTFSGLALTPEAVPAWLAGFENSTLLSGKSFSHFKLSENEQDITEFMVSSKNLEGATNE